MPKVITICGEQGVGKTTFFRYLVNKYSPTKICYQTKPVVNYAENLIKLENNTYKLIETPSFQIHPLTEIEKASQDQTEKAIKKSDLILWLVEEITEETLLIKKFFRKVGAPQILIRNKMDLVSQEENFSAYQMFKPKYFFPISALKTINIDKLLEQIVTLIPSLSTKPDIESERRNILISGPPTPANLLLWTVCFKKIVP